MAGKNSKQRIIKNPLEHVREIGDVSGIAKGVSKSLVDDLGKGAVQDFGNEFMQFLGLGSSASEQTKSADSSTGDLRTSGEIVSFEKKAKKAEQRIEAAIDYHRDVLKSRERFSHQEIASTSNQVQQIKMELRSLASSSKMLEMQFATVTMEQTPSEVGAYHTNFFEWVLNMIKDARKKVEDASSWLNAHKSKNNKKGYWNMFRKHGTSFGLSNERAVATQVG